MKFDELALDPEILQAIDAAGFEVCTPVQERAIPEVLQGKDVMVQSQTGTGKTAAFLLPAFQLLRSNERFRGSSMIVIAPTRELAVQIKEEAEVLSDGLGLKAEVFHGGVGYDHQQKALSQGVDIVVGTPGRIIDLSQSGHMDLRANGIMVIDEADRLFDMGFYPDLRKMLRRMRPREERLNMLFSATLSTKARNIAWEHMNDPTEIEVAPEQVTVDRVQQEIYHIASEDKMAALLGILNRDTPRNAIIFTNTKRAAEEVSRRLELNGFPSEFIMGDLPQRKRIAIINKIKDGKAEFLVATDVAARGLHINNLEMVINYDVPEDPEAYVHRIGRTARAGEQGRALTIACQRYVFGLDAIESLINQRIPVGTLTPEEFGEDASAGVRIRLDSSGRTDSRGPRRDGGGRRDSSRRDGPRRDHSPRREGGRREGARRDGPRRESSHRDVPRRDVPRGVEGGVHRSPRPVRRDAEARGPRSGESLEERLAYYRRKYGEDFQPTDEMLKNLGSGSGGSGEKKSSRSRSRSRSRSHSGSSRGGDAGSKPTTPPPESQEKRAPATPPAGEKAGEPQAPRLVDKLKSLFRRR